jgi:DNA-binding NtrC family response regulator
MVRAEVRRMAREMAFGDVRLSAACRAFEVVYAVSAVAQSGGNHTHAAPVLGIDRVTLQRILAKSDGSRAYADGAP